MALPQGFVDFTARYPILSGLPQALVTEPEVSVRINPAKISDYPLSFPEGAERQQSCSRESVPWCSFGMYLTERQQFTFDPKLHQGLYYVQDASSMAIDAVLRHLTADGAKVRYLDACAAPGGKTTVALAALPPGSVVVANEYDYRRAEILAENISKWGNYNVMVSRGDTYRLRKLRGEFDIVVVDAPCSGEGMMRKDVQAAEQWSPSLISQCAATQREILANAWEALRPGGYLIYSTCTFNLEENEANLHWLIEEYGASAVEIPALSAINEITPGIDTPYPCYRFLPGRIKGEGLFLAIVRKPGVSVPYSAGRVKPGKSTDVKKVLDRWFASDIEVMVRGEEVYALPAANAAFLCRAASVLDPVLIGVHAAEVKGRDIKPTHELALCTDLNPAAFPVCDVDYPTAIKYLRRDNVVLPAEAPRGFVLLVYDGHPLGIVKNLGNRTNSALPKPWRIVSQNMPEHAPDVI